MVYHICTPYTRFAVLYNKNENRWRCNIEYIFKCNSSDAVYALPALLVHLHCNFMQSEEVMEWEYEIVLSFGNKIIGCIIQ